MKLLERERVARNAGLGLRFWDTATGSMAIDGLKVEIFHHANREERASAKPNPSGIYVAHSLPRLRDFEFLDAETDDLWRTLMRPYRIEVTDPSERFLPIAFDAHLPARGPFTWLAPWLSPPHPVVLPVASGSPPQLMLERVPLFSAPSRPVPEPLAAVYGQLREFGSNREAASSVLGVAIDGVTRGLGLADDHGRVVVMFPYPEPPRMSLGSPPEARNDFAWEVALSAYWIPASPARPIPAFADLAEVFASLAAPRSVIASTLPPAPPLRLTYRQALVARTAGTAGADASFLFVS